MSEFSGISDEYRKSEEYKHYYSEIIKEYPKLPSYLIEMAINYHKINPKAYKDEYKNSKLPKPEKPPLTVLVDNAVEIYNSYDELPILPEIERIDKV